MCTLAKNNLGARDVSKHVWVSVQTYERATVDGGNTVPGSITIRQVGPSRAYQICSMVTGEAVGTFFSSTGLLGSSPLRNCGPAVIVQIQRAM